MSPAFGLPDYTVVNLGTLSTAGGPAEAAAVNATGQVAGSSSTNGSAIQHAFLWTPGGTDGVTSNPQMKDLGTLGGLFSFAYGINHLGQVVGASETEEEGPMHAFLWTPEGTDGVPGNPQMKDLGVLDGGFSIAYDINNVNDDPDQSQVTGMSQGSISRPFLWTPGGTDGPPSNPQMEDLGTLVHTINKALGINDLGQVAINSFSSLFSGQALLWTPGGTDGDPGNPQLKNLGTLGGGWAGASDVNNEGQVVGQADNAGGQAHAYLWTPGGTDGVPTNPQMKDLGAAGGDSSLAWGVNDISEVVGEISYNQNEQHAFVWTADSGMVDLNPLLASELSWVWSVASDTNDNGWIVGRGGVTIGGPKAFLLTPILECYLGDTDGDYDVDSIDLINVKNNFGDPGPDSPGDADCDGDTDSNDLIIVKNLFGTIYHPSGLNSIPEPASVALLALGGVMLLARRRS